MNALKRLFASLTALAMLVSVICIPVSAAEKEETIALSLEFLDGNYEPMTAETVISNGGLFYVALNFSGNPTVESDTIGSIHALLGYMPEVAQVSTTADEPHYSELLSNLLVNTKRGNDFVQIGWYTASGGIVKTVGSGPSQRKEIQDHGMIAAIFFDAKRELTLSDMQSSFAVISTRTVSDATEPLRTSLTDFNTNKFKLSGVVTEWPPQNPTYTVTVTNGEATPAEAKDPGVEAGTKVTVTADSKDGFVFQRWNGAEDLDFAAGNSTTSPATFYMPERDVKLTATYAASQKFQVGRDTWEFGNAAKDFGYVEPLGPGVSYPISAQTFAIIFGQSKQTTLLYKQIIRQIWNGNCLGMSGLSALMYKENDVSADAFRKNSVSELALTDSNGQISVKQFIEAMQIAQYSEMFATVNSRNKVDALKLRNGSNLNDIVREAREGAQQGKCPVVTVEKAMGGGIAGHALLACGFEETADGGRIHLYDCNYPQRDDRWMYVTRNGQGDYDGWRYEIGGNYGEWGSEDSACSISFIPCETMEKIWNNRGNNRGNLASSSGKEIVSLNVGNAEILNIYDNPVAKMENGAFIDLDESDDWTFIQVPHLSLNASDKSIVYMSMDYYTISNKETENFGLNIDAFSENYSAEIRTMSNKVKLGFDESSSGRAVDVLVSEAGDGELTTIKLTSYQANPNIDSMGEEGNSVVFNGYGAGLQFGLESDGTTTLPVYGVNFGADELTEKVKGATLSGGQFQVIYTSRVDAIMYAVSFQENGQMMEAVRAEIQADKTSVNLNFQKALPAHGYIKAFMLDKDTQKPLCDEFRQPL